MDTNEFTEVYTLTLTLTGNDAREYADGIYNGASYAARKTALLSALRDNGAVLEFTRTERTLTVYDLMHPDFDNSGADISG